MTGRDFARKKAVDRLRKAIRRDGITPERLKEAEALAHRKGFDEGTDHAVKCCYAACCLALKALYSFSPKQCREVVDEMDCTIQYAFESGELIDRALKEAGIQIKFEELFDRIEEDA